MQGRRPRSSKFIVAKSKEVKSGCKPAESFEKGYGKGKRAISLLMMTAHRPSPPL
jgi:hypothetical protein